MREEILRLIEKNSRIDIHEMAILLGAKEAEVANAIADMENEGVICGYYTLIDWDKTNDEKVTALIEVRVTPQRGSGFDEIAERIYKFEEVKAVYLMSGGFDFTVILEEKTISKKDVVKKYFVDILGKIGGEIKCSVPFLSLEENI